YSRLPFRDGEFDRVLSLETLEHAAEPLEFLKELHRVSTQDAILVLSCPPATSEIPYRIYSLFLGGHGEGPHRFPPSRRVKRMFALAGWNLLLHKGTVLFPAGPGWFQEWGEKIIERFQATFISELGIRQFYVCNKK
ncbi:MAG TPA: methyltransferase domain-containing protein, partial [Bacteroides sp.]|nr:methyltransferase domain-containing protein [Bacteroides sp.]